MNFDVLNPDGLFYVNVSLGDIIEHVINFYVFVTIIVSEYEYKNSSISRIRSSINSLRIRIVNSK
jgi:hypothetical protein